MKILSKAKYLPLFLLILSACKGNRLDVDISNIDVKPEVRRFEEEVFSLTAANFDQKIEAIRQKDTAFFYDYVVNYTFRSHIPVETGSDLNDSLKSFVFHPYIRKIYDEVHLKYAKMDDVLAEWKKALQYFKYHFPTKEIPKLQTCVSEFSFSVGPAAYRHAIGISLDKFLGQDFGGYAMMEAFPVYMLRRMSRQYIVQALSQALYAYHFEGGAADKTFLGAMIEEGKKQYFIDALLPNVHDTIRREYTLKQLEFCEKNQVQMWNYFAEHKLFFNSNANDFYRFMIDGPFTASPNVPPEAAPRLGMYCGWQIVKHYMEEHPEVTLPQLLAERDYQKILKQSKYKPG